MRKTAAIFIVAVLVPSLVLAAMAWRSLRDQRVILERQETLLQQASADQLAREVRDYMAGQQREFAAAVEHLLESGPTPDLLPDFDPRLRAQWPLARVGFVVNLAGAVLAPVRSEREEARAFLADNGGFLGNRFAVEVYQAPANFNNAVAASGTGVGEGKAANSLRQNVAPTEEARRPSVAAQKEIPAAAAPKEASQPAVFGTTVSSRAPAPVTAPAVSPPATEAQPARALGRTAPSDKASPGAAALPADRGAGFGAGSGGAGQARGLKGDSRPIGGVPVTRLGDDGATDSTDADQRAAGDSVVSKDSLRAAKAGAASTVDQDGSVAPDGSALKLKLEVQRARTVAPQKQQAAPDAPSVSQIVPVESDFRRIIGEGTEGIVARFVQDELSVLFWYRSPRDSNLVFGAQFDLAAARPQFDELLASPRLHRLNGASAECLALLDDSGKPASRSIPGFQADWRRPFVATEIGEALPHWEAAVYLTDPGRLLRSAESLARVLGGLILVSLAAIAAGGWLVVRDLRREVELARRKTDFVSNVSHELKTPLTSIRMFSELLAEERVPDEDKRRQYAAIISAEAARLSRLIHNVLDFSRLERGETRLKLQPCDLLDIVRDTTGTYRAHLESSGFTFDVQLPPGPAPVQADRDAIAQVLLNLLSNAEKYGGDAREIRVEAEARPAHWEVRVLDRGPGVPRGCETRIFEKFYRAHDSLASGIQGSGLGLTLARQIARTHGGDVTLAPRPGGGSCFTLHLPAQPVPA